MSVSAGPRPSGPEIASGGASPPARRHRSRAWRDPRLAIGVVLVAASALAGATLLGGGDATVGVWAVRTPLPAGHSVSVTDLVRREVRFAGQGDADRYVSADRALPTDAVLGRDVGAGELLPRGALAGPSADRLLEVPLEVPSGALPAGVRAGVTVDVWVVPDMELSAAEEAEESRLVLEDVPVLAVSRDGSALGPTPTRQVIIGLAAAEEDSLPRTLTALARGSALLVRVP